MTKRSRLNAAGVVLAYSLSALVPPAWPCPIDWEQISLATFLHCSVILDNFPAACAVAAAQACESEIPADLRSFMQENMSMSGGCPLRTSTESTAPASEKAPSKRGRAYRLGDPGGGPSVRGHVIELAAIFTSSFGVVSQVVEPPPALHFAWRPEARARPPNEVWSSTPPVRGPPV